MSKIRPNLTDQKFGRLSVVAYAGEDKYGRSTWRCLCDCGNSLVVSANSLRKVNTKSCGCYARDVWRDNNPSFKHGHARKGRESSEYRAYKDAKTRCSNPKRKDYGYYGGRGIEFRFANFAEFYAELGSRPTPRHSVDRMDVNGHYEKGNVRWATKKEQSQNRRPRELAHA
jgi:hypothetical protein